MGAGPQPGSASSCIFYFAVLRGGERIIAEGSQELFVWGGIAGELNRHLALPSNDWFAFLPGGDQQLGRGGVGFRDREAVGRIRGRRLSAAEGGFEVSPCGRLKAVRALNDIDPVESLAMWDTLSGRILFKEGAPYECRLRRLVVWGQGRTENDHSTRAPRLIVNGVGVALAPLTMSMRFAGNEGELSGSGFGARRHYQRDWGA